MKKPFRLSALFAATALSFGLAASAHAEVVKIGFVGPITGPLTQYGDMVLEGMNTAIEAVNDAGGINGNTFEIVRVDDACEPKQGPIAANNIINQKIGFVVGPVCTGATVAAASILDEQGVVTITPSGTGPVITDDKNFHFIFRSIGRDDQQGPAAAEYIINVAKPQRLAVLHDKQSYGQGIAASVRDEAKNAGINVVMFEGINAGESDYSAILTSMRSNDVDFVYFGGYHPEMGLLLRQAKELGFEAPFMGPEGVGNPDVNAIAGDAVEGMLLTLPADYSARPENAEIVEAFKAKNRNPSGAFQLTAYAATQAILKGIEETKSTDPEKVADWLHANKVSTVLGDISWNEQGDLTEFVFDVFKWHADGSKSLAK
ncbi:Leucine-, isoleucine-, valine-, threonine-, and alanine-binding protein [Oligella urethralis]|uniref:Leucine-, isoleucine-, valine-, threonine-, and alanine-binding protein n=1 Tax=Oligella urethralis TaxID=90245 RepID=A0A2X1WJH1_9BURK|nr:high-affinity branched-chain amino acid ABC transporter substrate-binding protein [Oligella urethralis]WOS37934.1 Leucine-, isoleucine-, valine-, threonine-, and alanine-binding protein [Oligella urethralis]SPY06945.1 Leucine-, isoleucine-, valine-, threonine-, and alanine-binding protein precursor [Oligella urethralis]SUA65807.1 Leucine-, isoleucine-, valine-, threonine-, and alanine-binding protein precursor [Oligella urethralis]